MADDIVQLAALRKRRRPRTGRSGETTLFHNENASGSEDITDENDPLQPEVLLVEPPRPRGTRQREQSQNEAEFEESLTPRSRGTRQRQQSQNEAEFEESLTPRSRGTRQRQQSQNEAEFEEATSDNKTPLPFVQCKISDTKLTALISTTNKQSLLNRDVYNKIRNGLSVEPRRHMHKVNITFRDLQISLHVEVQDDIPDAIFGVDFLVENNCEVNFKDRTLLIQNNGSAEVPFLKETEIPLKFRLHRNMAASF